MPPDCRFKRVNVRLWRLTLSPWQVPSQLGMDGTIFGAAAILSRAKTLHIGRVQTRKNSELWHPERMSEKSEPPRIYS